jgi:soluble lytic murein transglycosylase-like protein
MKAATLGFLLVTFAFKGPNIEASAGVRANIKYDEIIEKISSRHNMDPALIHAIIAAESNYNRFAVSHRGAQGLMQLMPETARGYGVENTFDAAENIEGGIKYIKDLQKLYPGQKDLILAAYNAGQKAVKKYGGMPPYPETKKYVRLVKKIYYRESSTKKPEIYEFLDERGKTVITNDIRLVAAARRQVP